MRRRTNDATGQSSVECSVTGDVGPLRGREQCGGERQWTAHPPIVAPGSRLGGFEAYLVEAGCVRVAHLVRQVNAAARHTCVGAGQLNCGRA